MAAQIKQLPWHKEPHGLFWRAECAGMTYEVFDDEVAEYKKKQCQFDFETRIRDALENPTS